MSTHRYEYLILDVETTVNSSRSFKGTPFDTSNYIVLAGLKYPSGVCHFYDFVNDNDSHPYGIHDKFISDISDTYILVGQNIGFDLHYVRKYMNDEYWYEWIQNVSIWDTQIAEYLLCGHTSKFQSLDALSTKYGGELKDDAIKGYWDSGIKTEEIPKEELTSYLMRDLTNTSIVFEQQRKHPLMEDRKFRKVLSVQMEHRLVTLEMEHNGMKFDQLVCSDQLGLLRTHIKVLTQELIKVIDTYIGDYVVSNPLSHQHIKLVLSGGELKYDSTETIVDDDFNPVLYLTGSRAGEFKTRKVRDSQNITGMLDFDIQDTSNSTLKNIIKSHRQDEVGLFCSNVLRLRKVTKDAGTYFEGYSKECWEHDSCIHPNYNHAATNTGRISCTKPNVMNITRKET